MSELHAIQIASWNHPEVQGELVDTVGLPFNPYMTLHSVPVIVNENLTENATPTTIPLRTLSEFHGRSFDISTDDQPIAALWQDKFGNSFTSLSTKGNKFTQQTIVRSATAPSGYLPHGLQEDDALLRILKSSNLIRNLGIATEWITGIHEPSVLAYGNELVSQSDYKRLLLKDTLADPTQDFDEVILIANAIQNMTFFVTTRAMEINDRPWDFEKDQTVEAVIARVEKIFRVYNQTHTKDADFRVLDSASESDREYYFGEIFPRLRAENLAKLHNAGLVHKFPVIGNVHALGGIIDLDSIHGEPLGIGDKPITTEDIINDLVMVLADTDHATYDHTLKHLESIGMLRNRLGKKADQVFLDTYFAERGFSQNNPKRLSILLELAEKNDEALILFNGHHSTTLLKDELVCSPAYKNAEQILLNMFTPTQLDILARSGKEFATERLDHYFNDLEQIEVLDLDMERFHEILGATTHGILFDSTYRAAEKIAQQSDDSELPEIIALCQSLGIPAEKNLLLRKVIASVIGRLPPSVDSPAFESIGDIIADIMPGYLHDISDARIFFPGIDPTPPDFDVATIYKGHQIVGVAQTSLEVLLKLVHNDPDVTVIRTKQPQAYHHIIISETLDSLDFRYVATDANKLELMGAVSYEENATHDLISFIFDRQATYVAKMSAPDEKGHHILQIYELADED